MRLAASLFLSVSMTLLASCAMGDWLDDDSSSTPKRKGWRYGGVFAENDANNGYGFSTLEVAKSYLLIRSSYGKLYLGQIGDTSWAKIFTPTNNDASAIISNGELFFVATYKGEVFEFHPETNTWKDLAPVFPGLRRPIVQGLALFQGRLFANVTDSTTTSYMASMDLVGGTWQSEMNGWEGVDKYNTGFAFIDGQEMLGDLYVTTYSAGLWRYRSGSWSQIPHARDAYDDGTIITNLAGDTIPYKECVSPRAMLPWNGELLVGCLTGRVFAWNPTTETWRRTDTKGMRLLPEGGRETWRTSPLEVMSLATDGNRVFAVGQSSIPRIMIDNVEQYWPYVSSDNWCQPGDEPPGGRICETYSTDMAVVGDTLYTLGIHQLMKIPLQDIVAVEVHP